MQHDKKLILASCSPRRRELIKFLGLPFECISVDADESTSHKNPEAAVKEIAAKKAAAEATLRILLFPFVLISLPYKCDKCINAKTFKSTIFFCRSHAVSKYALLSPNPALLTRISPSNLLFWVYAYN